ncbi:anti-sigma factor family protein [Sphingomonas adhaesiva]|uniref:anti-sigma factor family protein n=1 Tax=Sphingomonas adhaesiva TaxID=28212 RepID=UPI002FFAD00C
MTIEPEMLMAYADGELDPIAAKRVERAIADDPRLGDEVARHRALAARMRDALAPAAQAPVPEAIARMLHGSASVTPIAAARPATRGWIGWAGAIAASLVVGVMTGQMLSRDAAPIALAQSGAVVRGDIAHALDTQLASTQQADAPVRVGVSFRNAQGSLCRTFERAAVAGIACSDGGDWGVARLYGGAAAPRGAFRQAGSANAAMMADAQAMAVGEPMDATAERRALSQIKARRD